MGEAEGSMNFLDFAAGYGLMIRHIDYGKWKRVPTTDHPHKKNGAYIHTGDFAAIQNWATMDEPAIWHPDRADNAPQIDRAAMARRRAADESRLRQDRENAAKKAREIVKECTQAQHAYLDRKGFPDMRGLVYREDSDNLLVVPMYAGKMIVGCQMIDVDGEKKFLHGQQAKGAEFVIGRGDLHAWCEGYATGLSIHAAAKQRLTVHVCFSAGNLTLLAKQAGNGIVVADNDASGTGEKAAQATGLPYYMPPTVGQDFNDLHREQGLFRATMALNDWMRNNLRKGRG